jgi:phage-related protein
MRAMNDAIFENEMAQKRLQLQMMDWEDVNGSLDDLRNNYQGLMADIELLRGETNSLRAAGAGSDITGPLQAQMAAMEAQADALNQTISDSPINQMQRELEALQRQAERMDLEKALQFEPLQHQIENLIDTTQELTFDQIITGIQNEQAAMATLQPQIDSLTTAVNSQQAAVNAAKLARDQIQATYDAENAKLQTLKDQYGKTADAIRDVEEALRSMGTAASAANSAAAAGGAASKAAEKLSPGAVNFKGAAGGGFPDVGNMAKIGREAPKGMNLMDDQSKMIENFTKGINAQVTEMFDKISIKAPLKKKWDEAVQWLKERIGIDMGGVSDAITGAFGNLKNPFAGEGGFASGARDTFNSVKEIVTDVFESIGKALKIFEPDVKRIFHAIVDAGQKLWTELGPQIKKFGKIWEDLGPALHNVWEEVKPLVALFGIALLGAIKLVASIISNTLGPVLTVVITILADVVQAIVGAIEIVVGILSGDWALAWQGAKDLVVGLVTGILDVIVAVFATIGSVIKGIVVGIVEIFQWLYDVLIGHSIIPDLVQGILALFKWLGGAIKPTIDVIVTIVKVAFQFIATIWNTVVKPAWDAMAWFLKNVLGPAFSFLWNDVIKPVFGWIGDKIDTVWKSVIKPTFEKIRDFINDDLKPAFNTLKDAIGNAFDKVANAARIPFNFVINSVYNNGLKALFDKVAGAVGLNWKLPHVDEIPKFARGGAVWGPGTGTSDSITAKLSRGEHVWTAKEVANAGGHNAVAQIRAFFNGKSVQQMKRDSAIGGEKFGLGGAWDWVTDKVGDAKDWAVTKTLDWVANRAKDTINLVLNALPVSGLADIGRHGALSAADKVLHFAAALAHTAWDSPLMDGKAGIQDAQKWAKSQVGKPYIWGGVGPNGYDCSGFMSAITNVIRGKNPYSRVGTTASFPWAGFAGGRGDFTIGSTNRYPGSTVGHMAGTLGSLNVESRGDRGVIVGSGARGFMDSGFNSFASISAAAHGALVRATRDGSLLRVGEGGRDEAVVPLPRSMRNSLAGGFGKNNDSGEKHFHFYGDLSFPNITDGDDAETFISNLEILVKD